MRKITNLWKFGLTWSSKLQENNERKTPLLHKSVLSASGLMGSFNIWMKNYLKNYVTSEPFPTMFYIYQQLSIARFKYVVNILTIILGNNHNSVLC